MRGLPPDALCHGGWDVRTELQALQAELTHSVMGAVLLVAKLLIPKPRDRQKVRIPDPLRLPRPGGRRRPVAELEPGAGGGFSVQSVRSMMMKGGRRG